jgi:hypothetical protein
MKIYVYISLLTTLAIGTLLSVGCGNSDNGDGNTATPSIPEKAEYIVSIAKHNLAQKLDVSLGEIKIHSLTEVEWHDTSLGFPEPGMAYDQVITPGFELVFTVDDQLYLYGTGEGDLIHYCGPISSEEIEERHVNASYQDGWPNQPVYGGYVIIKPLED